MKWEKPDWEKWGHFENISIDKAVALSINLDPDVVTVNGEFSPFDDLCDSGKAALFAWQERLDIIKSKDQFKDKGTVKLPDFACWFLAQSKLDYPEYFASFSEEASKSVSEGKELSEAYAVIGCLLSICKERHKRSQDSLILDMSGESAKYRMHNIGERKIKNIFSNGNKELDRARVR